MLLSNKTAVITGGASGIGLATAEELLKCGVSKILLLDLGTTLNSAQETHLKAHNPNATVFYAQCDVTNKTRLETILRQDAIQWLGSIDILVNSAGIFDNDPARCIGTNLIGLVDCTFIAVDLMSKTKSGNGGVVVNISSIAGLEPSPLCAVYGASKFGVTGFTRCLGSEALYNETGVKVVAICPGATNTNILNAALSDAAALKMLEKMTVQEPSVVAKCVVKVITEGETGSVWVASDNKIAQVHFEANKFLT
ncbi:alcohol dehydrogenase 2-like [Topomyia yanbarensis]|uniref:alcohol dehydrogenase 2-like n=1 Tax=Topomyia yanbarensis TaxID=2498891 RepID=UPI00273BE443|nr:alcohol dehydrogenase 2-like [Topomyia yanbarensis]